MTHERFQLVSLRTTAVNNLQYLICNLASGYRSDFRRPSTVSGKLVAFSGCEIPKMINYSWSGIDFLRHLTIKFCSALPARRCASAVFAMTLCLSVTRRMDGPSFLPLASEPGETRRTCPWTLLGALPPARYRLALRAHHVPRSEISSDTTAFVGRPNDCSEILSRQSRTAVDRLIKPARCFSASS